MAGKNHRKPLEKPWKTLEEKKHTQKTLLLGKLNFAWDCFWFALFFGFVALVASWLGIAFGGAKRVAFEKFGLLWLSDFLLSVRGSPRSLQYSSEEKVKSSIFEISTSTFFTFVSG